MLNEQSFLALRLEGPLQSWGADSQYNRRNTGLMPTKSGIAGICCAALGYGRGTGHEQEFLVSFRKVRMTAIAIPRKIKKKGKQYNLSTRRLQDYHTVQNTRRATGSINTDCVLTYRQYISDAAFGVLLKGETELLKKIATALENPVWGVWLGRKCCVPTAPVLAGLKYSREDAIRLLLGDNALDDYTRQSEALNFTDGRDSIPDSPVSFALGRRIYSPRRIITEHKT